MDAVPPQSHQAVSHLSAWPKIAILVVLVVVGSVLIWRFAPIDDAINNILPSFNNTGNGSDDPSDGSKSPPPTASPNDFVFNQCTESDAECCNGLPNICGLRANEVFYATAHNAMATIADGYLIAPNHRFQLEDALKAGFRGINLDVCNCGASYRFCHGICELATRDIEQVLTAINQFLEDNPNEVLYIPFELFPL